MSTLSATAAPCMVTETGWSRPTGGPAVPFTAQGRDLTAELTRWAMPGPISPAPTLAEEVGAVLEGRFVLHCGDEHHELSAGQAVLVPAGEPRDWELNSEYGVLYRVWRHKEAVDAVGR